MSSIILMVIVVAWAVVLVPVLLNRHEATHEARSADRFASAMRVLSRRSAVAGDPRGGSRRDLGRRYVVMPRRPHREAQIVVNGTTRYASASAQPAPAPAVPSAPAPIRSSAAGRRRRVVAILAALALTTAAIAVGVSPLAWVAHAVCDVLVVAYLWQVRRVVSRSRRPRTEAVTAPASPPHASGYARAIDPPQFTLPDNAVVIERQEDGSWRPVPVPLPTYLTAPVAAPAAPAPAGQTEQAPGETRRLLA